MERQARESGVARGYTVELWGAEVGLRSLMLVLGVFILFLIYQFLFRFLEGVSFGGVLQGLFSCFSGLFQELGRSGQVWGGRLVGLVQYVSGRVVSFEVSGRGSRFRRFYYSFGYVLGYFFGFQAVFCVVWERQFFFCLGFGLVRWDSLFQFSYGVLDQRRW